MSEEHSVEHSPKQKVFARRFLVQRLLCLSLFLGAAYDVFFAGLMLFAPELPARLLSLPVPIETFYLWLLALFLVMLALLYTAAGMNPRRYSVIIAVAILGRALGAVAFVAAAWGRPDLQGLYPLAAADALFAFVHGALWLPLRRS